MVETSWLRSESGSDEVFFFVLRFDKQKIQFHKLLLLGGLRLDLLLVRSLRLVWNCTPA